MELHPQNHHRLVDLWIRAKHNTTLLMVAMNLSLFVLIVIVAAFMVPTTTAQLSSGPFRRRVVKVECAGAVEIPTGEIVVDELQFGGISGVAYNPEMNLYYALSDDRSFPRFYTLTIDFEDDYHLDQQDIQVLGVTRLLNEQGEELGTELPDPEGIFYKDGHVYVSSERNLNGNFPEVYKVDVETGEIQSRFTVPEYYEGTTSDLGVRNNLGFESLTITPDGTRVWAAIEGALVQDGERATLDDGSYCRMVSWKITDQDKPLDEHIYITDPIAVPPIPAGGFADSGLTELLAIDNNGSFLALERSFSLGTDGRGYNCRLFEASAQGALNLKGIPDTKCVSAQGDVECQDLELEGESFEIDPPVQKRELINLNECVAQVDNLEALTIPFELPDGRVPLLVTSDDNFSAFGPQANQFILLILTFETIPLVDPALESPQAEDNEQGSALLLGDSDDPAIWIHPKDTDKSLVFATLKDGGLAVLDLTGTLLDKILPAPFGDIRYNNVDIVYAYKMGGGLIVDLVVASDRQNDSLAIWKINPVQRTLTMVTSSNMLESIFGVDDGEATAYGLTSYTSPVTGLDYVFVTQADGNQVAQLLLENDGESTVTASVVRLIELPFPTGDVGDSQSEGIVVDRVNGNMYVALEEEVGILKFGAEPEDEDVFVIIFEIDEDVLKPDIEGLTIYYRKNGSGYLLASSQGDSTVAVFDLPSDTYIGSFAVGEKGSIDQTNESDGMDVVNTPLGSAFPCGLLVAQDGADDPQVVVQDEEELENSATNFKFIPWEGVANALPLEIDPFSWGPRRYALSIRIRMLVDEIASTTSGGMQSLLRLLENAAKLLENGSEREDDGDTSACKVPSTSGGKSQAVRVLLENAVKSPMPLAEEWIELIKEIGANVPEYFF